jgi:ABC-2 type transport system permease protein
MSTVALSRRPVRAATGVSNFAGTSLLLRLVLRRDRLVLPLWVLLLSVPLAPVYIGATDRAYPTAADRASLARSIMGSPAQRAMYGPVYNDSLGAVGIWKAGIFYTLIAIAVILTVIRHTRVEEEAGRTELLDSTAIGRYAGLTAALVVGFGASLLTGMIGAAMLFRTDVPHSGSAAFGLALAASGCVFAAVPRSPHNSVPARGSPAASHSVFSVRLSRCARSAMPVREHSRGCRRSAGRFKCARTRATDGGCSHCIS